MSTDARTLLTSLPGCERLGPESLDLLARECRLEDFAPSTTLVTEGAPAPDWYGVVASGTLRLSQAGESVDALTAGDVLDPGPPGLPAACSVVVEEPTRCLLVPQAAVARYRDPSALESPGAYRGDLALFVRRVRDLMHGPAVTCPAGTSVAEAARLMTRHGVGSVVVAADDGTPRGIVTDRDLRTKVVSQGMSTASPVTAIMSSPLLSIGPEALAFDALLEMTRRNIRHLGVIEGGRLVGVVSSHDVFRLQGTHPVALVREIEGQTSVEGLVAAAPQLQAVIRWLVREGAGALDVGRVVAELNDRLVRRAVALAESAVETEGHGRPPVPYSWLAAGSEGRLEQTLRTDQDNGLVYADPPDAIAPRARAYFERLARTAGSTLERLGFPLCDGGFMASNPAWCQPATAWQETFASWMTNPHPDRLLAACIYFDARPVAGDPAPGRALLDGAVERASAETLFLRHLSRVAVERHPPLGFFGRFVVERSGAHKAHLDLKARGVFPVTMTMRVYALALGVRETNTVDRLQGAGARGAFTAAQVDELREAYEVISRLRLTHQLACLDAGGAADNFVDPQALGKADRLLLREAFRSVAWLQAMLEDRFQTGSMA